MGGLLLTSVTGSAADQAPQRPAAVAAPTPGAPHQEHKEHTAPNPGTLHQSHPEAGSNLRRNLAKRDQHPHHWSIRCVGLAVQYRLRGATDAAYRDWVLYVLYVPGVRAGSGCGDGRRPLRA